MTPEQLEKDLAWYKEQYDNLWSRIGILERESRNLKEEIEYREKAFQLLEDSLAMYKIFRSKHL